MDYKKWGPVWELKRQITPKAVYRGPNLAVEGFICQKGAPRVEIQGHMVRGGQDILQENERGCRCVQPTCATTARGEHVWKQEQVDGRAGTGERGGEHGRNLQCDPRTILKIPLYYMYFYEIDPPKLIFYLPINVIFSFNPHT